MTQTSNPFALAMAEAESRPVKAKRRMPVAPPHAILAAGGGDDEYVRSRLLCGHCGAKWPGIYDLTEYHRLQRADRSGWMPVLFWSDMWRRERETWVEDVWQMVRNVRRRAQRSGKVRWRRGRHGGQALRDRSDEHLTLGWRSDSWDGHFPAWVQCWRCEAINLVETAPLWGAEFADLTHERKGLGWRQSLIPRLTDDEIDVLLAGM